MATADTLILGAGALAFIGNMKEQGGIPANSPQIIGGTVALTFLAAIAERSPIAPAAKAFAALVLLVAVYRYIPGLFNRKGKNNG